jgi:hypothetical protein
MVPNTEMKKRSKSQGLWRKSKAQIWICYYKSLLKTFDIYKVLKLMRLHEIPQGKSSNGIQKRVDHSVPWQRDGKKQQ